MDETKAFELEIRKRIDAKYRRPATEDNPFARLLRGDLPREECHALFGGMLGSLLNFNQILLPRLLRMAPSVELRVELMSVVAIEFGVTGPQDAHPTFFLDFLRALGVNVDPEVQRLAVQSAAVREEAAYLRSLSWCELLTRILVGESLGPKVFLVVDRALRRSYNLTPRSTIYFSLHAKHDKKDAEVLFDLVRREARSDDQKRRVENMIDTSFDFGRYAQYGCALSDEMDYDYARLFERRTSRASRPPPAMG